MTCVAWRYVSCNGREFGIACMSGQFCPMDWSSSSSGTVKRARWSRRCWREFEATMYTQDDPTFPEGVDCDPRCRPVDQLAPRHRDRTDPDPRGRRQRGRAHGRLAAVRLAAHHRLDDTRRRSAGDATGLRVDERRPQPRRFAACEVRRRRGAIAPNRVGRPRRRDGDAVRPRRDRWSAGNSSDRANGC